MPSASIDITESLVLTALRAFILSLLPDVEVIRGLNNRVATPKYDFIAMTPVGQKRLATNITPTPVYSPAPTAQGQQSQIQLSVQVDCYGASAGNWAAMISTMFRSEYATEQFALSELAIVPLYADEVRQLPMVDGESQWEERWMVEVQIQFNPTVTVPQQYADELGPAGIVNVDVKYLEPQA